jgi:hypothetical protein
MAIDPSNKNKPTPVRFIEDHDSGPITWFVNRAPNARQIQMCAEPEETSVPSANNSQSTSQPDPPLPKEQLRSFLIDFLDQLAVSKPPEKTPES